MKRFERLVASPAALLVTLLVAVPLAAGLVTLMGFSTQVFTAEPQPTESAIPTGEDDRDVVPVFTPGGTAAQNREYFDYTNKQTAVLVKPALGKDFIDGLVKAGFDKAAMQLTPDRTAADLDADSIQFSVQIGAQCLVGQYGTGSNGYRSQILPAVPGIGCLIGKTRPIDW